MKFSDLVLKTKRLIPAVLSTLATSAINPEVTAQSRSANRPEINRFADMASQEAFARITRKIDAAQIANQNSSIQFGEVLKSEEIPKGYKEMCESLSQKIDYLLKEFETFCKKNGWPVEVNLEMNSSVLDQIEYIQNKLNKQIKPANDLILYGRPEVWVASKYVQAGDCEDYAIAKLLHLLELGIPRGAMSIAVVNSTIEQRGGLHAVLLVTLNRNGKPFTLVLDNLVEHVMLLSEAKHLELMYATTAKITEWKRISR